MDAVNVATDITVDLEDRPHALAAFVETMAAAGVEIEGFCGLYADGADRPGPRGRLANRPPELWDDLQPASPSC